MQKALWKPECNGLPQEKALCLRGQSQAFVTGEGGGKDQPFERPPDTRLKFQSK